MSAFLLFTVCASVAPGLIQRTVWPFPAWTVFQLRMPADIEEVRLLAVDARGDEHAVDGRAWEPFSQVELWAWARHQLPQLGPEAQDAAAAYLLELANAGRSAVLAGTPPGRFERHLGALAAPIHILPRRIWHAPADVPAETLTGLRIYRYEWNVNERRRDPARVWRTLLLAYPRP